MGEDPIFERIYERFHPRVLAYCMRRLPAADAGDAAAEVFATAWRRRDDMPRGDQALPWLYGVARNVLGHHWRGADRRHNLAARARGQRTPPPLTPEDVLVEHEDHVRVRAALDRLSPQDQEILMLSAWEGLSHADMAAALGASMAAIDKRLVRAKKRLARQFDVVARTGSETKGGGATR